MTNRRVDAIYFLLLISAAVIGTIAAQVWPDEEEIRDLPDFSPPRLELEAPFEMTFELPFTIVRYASPPPPTLVLAGHMPNVLTEVRTALLESSKPVALPAEPTLVASSD